MATWANATKNSASFTFAAKSSTPGSTIEQGIKFMGHIMQYSEDISIGGGSPTVWADATKN